MTLGSEKRYLVVEEGTSFFVVERVGLGIILAIDKTFLLRGEAQAEADRINDGESGIPTMSEQFTGPWVWTKYGDLCSADGLHVIYAYATADCPRECDYYECAGPKPKAILRVPDELKLMIAAAPDMLAALKAITDLCKTDPADLFLADKMDRIAIAVIARAEGKQP